MPAVSRSSLRRSGQPSTVRQPGPPGPPFEFRRAGCKRQHRRYSASTCVRCSVEGKWARPVPLFFFSGVSSGASSRAVAGGRVCPARLRAPRAWRRRRFSGLRAGTVCGGAVSLWGSRSCGRADDRFGLVCPLRPNASGTGSPPVPVCVGRTEAIAARSFGPRNRTFAGGGTRAAFERHAWRGGRAMSASVCERSAGACGDTKRSRER